MTSKLKEINFNDLPGEIKLKIYNINKEDQKKNEYQIYTHLNGKFTMFRKRSMFINYRGEEVVENSWNYKLQNKSPIELCGIGLIVLVVVRILLKNKVPFIMRVIIVGENINTKKHHHSLCMMENIL